MTLVSLSPSRIGWEGDEVQGYKLTNLHIGNISSLPCDLCCRSSVRLVVMRSLVLYLAAAVVFSHNPTFPHLHHTFHSLIDMPTWFCFHLLPYLLNVFSTEDVNFLKYW